MNDPEPTAASAYLDAARAAILRNIIEQGDLLRSIRDAIPCPICEMGKLWYVYSGRTTGRISAACSTAGCIAWVE